MKLADMYTLTPIAGVRVLHFGRVPAEQFHGTDTCVYTPCVYLSRPGVARDGVP